MKTRKSRRDRKIDVEATNKDLVRSKTTSTVIHTETVSHSATVTHVSRSPEVTHHEYVDDSWHKRPKTDYTYSRSGSYSPTGLGDDCINPNMSRSRLKHYDIWLETTESTSQDTLQRSSSSINTTGLHTPPHTPATYTVKRTESVSTHASLPRSCTRSGLRYSTGDYRKTTVRKNSLSPSRSWRGGGDSVSNSNASSQSPSPTYTSSKKNKSTISTQTKELRRIQRSVAATNQSSNCQSAVISQSESHTTRLTCEAVHSSSSSRGSRRLSRSRSCSPDDSRLSNISTTANKSIAREVVCQLNQSSNAVVRKRSVTNRARANTDWTLKHSQEVTDCQNVNQSASSSWLPNRSRSQSGYCIHGNNLSHLYGLDSTDGEFSDHDECTMLYSRRGYPCTPYKTPSRRQRLACPNDGPCGMCRVFRQLGCFLCSLVNLIVQCLFGLVMFVWCAVGGVLHSFITDTVLRDVWLLSKTKRVRRKCNFCYLLPVFIIIPLLLSGAYCVYRRGSGIEKFPLWSFFNLPVFRAYEVNDQLDMMADKLQYPHENSAHKMSPPYREKEHTPSLVQQGVDYMQHLWAWESHQPHMHQQQRQGIVGIDRSQIEAIVRAAVQKQLSDLGIQAGVTDTGSGDARFAQAQLQQAAQITSLQGQIQAVDKMLQDITAELQGTKEHIDRDAEVSRTETLDNVRQLEQRQAQLQADAIQLKESQLALIEQLKKCCKNDAALKLLVRAGVQEQLAAVMLGEQRQGKVCMDENCRDKIDSPFATWLQTQFMSRADMDSQIVQLGAKLNQQIKNHARAAAMDAVAAAGAAQAAASRGSNMLGVDDGLPTKDQVKALIQEALLVFDADKTGIADYALESSGGSIVSTRCSTTYHRRTAQLSLFGIPLWYASNSPRTVIQPGTHPGQCWAFRGSHGYLLIQLSGFVKISGVSLEHIPKSLSPTGHIDSAPKDFTVWGLQDEHDRNGVLLGNYTYREDKLPLQFFSVQNSKAGAFNFVELQVLSNHGNLEFTCLYRFRVHGHIHG